MIRVVRHNLLLITAPLLVFCSSAIAGDDDQYADIDLWFEPDGSVWFTMNVQGYGVEESSIRHAIASVFGEADVAVEVDDHEDWTELDIDVTYRDVAETRGYMRSATIDLSPIAAQLSGDAYLWIALPASDVNEISVPMEYVPWDSSVNYYKTRISPSEIGQVSVQYGFERLPVQQASLRLGATTAAFLGVLWVWILIGLSRPVERAGAVLLSIQYFLFIWAFVAVVAWAIVWERSEVVYALSFGTTFWAEHAREVGWLIDAAAGLVLAPAAQLSILPLYRRIPGCTYKVSDFLAIGVGVGCSIVALWLFVLVVRNFGVEPTPWLTMIVFVVCCLALSITAPRALNSLALSRQELTGEALDAVNRIAEKIGLRFGCNAYLMYFEKFPVWNAAAYGQRQVMLSDRLITDVPRNEVDAIIAHELAHVKLGHAERRVYALAAAVLAFLFAPRLLDEVIHPGLYVLVAPLLLYAACMWYFRKQELDADRLAAEVLDRPADLADGLERAYKLNRYGEGEGSRLWRPFRAHPPLSKRVSKLRSPKESGNSADVEPSPYAVPPRESQRLFSATYRYRQLRAAFWKDYGSHTVILFIVAGTYDWIGSFTDLNVWGYLMVAGPLAFAAFTLVVARIDIRMVSRLKDRLKRKLDIQGPDWHFVGFVPTAEVRDYNGFECCDIGFLRFHNGTLDFRGDDVSFRIPRGSIGDIYLEKTQRTRWMSDRTMAVQWTLGDESVTFGFSDASAPTMFGVPGRTTRIVKKARQWLTKHTPDSAADFQMSHELDELLERGTPEMGSYSGVWIPTLYGGICGVIPAAMMELPAASATGLSMAALASLGAGVLFLHQLPLLVWLLSHRHDTLADDQVGDD